VVWLVQQLVTHAKEIIVSGFVGLPT